MTLDYFRPFLHFVSVCTLLLTASCTSDLKHREPLKIIFDTDMGPDYDDVGAITMLHAYADSGKVEILATMASTKYEGVAAVLSVLNTYFRRPDLPIGVPKGEALTLKDFQHWTDTLISKYPHTIIKNEDAPDAVTLYRKVLVQQPDNSVTIVTVGFLTNIANLLQSPPDEISSLSGKELVDKKVQKLVSMAGKFPEGGEFNIREDAASAKYAFENFKNPVIFSGFEIGEKIKAGLPLIHNATIHNSPVKDVFRISIPLAAEDSLGRKSWDETAVLVAVNGIDPYYKMQKGSIEIADDGTNHWKEGSGNQGYLLEVQPSSHVQRLINDLLMHQPTE
jgi:inosine-uridine nucleoside N-ribohydrolase